MIRILGTILVGLLGLAFGSFLNVCLSRLPEGESVVGPRSHCRRCGQSILWWENLPVLSWLALRGRCRTCKAWIGWRYPLVEATIGVLWAMEGWFFLGAALDPLVPPTEVYRTLVYAVGRMILFWILLALALLDFEHLWLPDWFTIPGTALGFVFTMVSAALAYASPRTDSPLMDSHGGSPLAEAIVNLLGIAAAAGLVLAIRWVYWMLRRREGIGLGDAKLMGLLAAWLGFPQALLAFGLGVILGAIAGLLLLAFSIQRNREASWTLKKLPLGTFLCIGGAISALWGERIIAAYLKLAGV